jgi:hypothetical protein
VLMFSRDDLDRVLLGGITFELTPRAEASGVSPGRDNSSGGADRAYAACRSASGVERGVRPHSHGEEGVELRHDLGNSPVLWRLCATEGGQDLRFKRGQRCSGRFLPRLLKHLPRRRVTLTPDRGTFKAQHSFPSVPGKARPGMPPGELQLEGTKEGWIKVIAPQRNASAFE